MVGHKRILVTSGILGSARRAGREYVGPRGRWCALIVWGTEDDDDVDDVEDVDDGVRTEYLRNEYL